MAKQRRKSMAAGQLKDGIFIVSDDRATMKHDDVEATIKEIQCVTATTSPVDIPGTYERELVKLRMLMTTARDVTKVRDETSKKYRYYNYKQSSVLNLCLLKVRHTSD